MKYTLVYKTLCTVTFSLMLLLCGFLLPPTVKGCSRCSSYLNKNLSVEQDALLTVADLYLCNYMEAKMKNIGIIKIKLRQLIIQADQRGDKAVLEHIYDTLGGLLILYKDKFLHDLYFEVKACVDKYNEKPRVDASNLAGILEQ